jgi:hypothetical protein
MSPDAPWTDRVLGRLSQVVSLRRVGAEVAGEDATARAARAEANADDLEAAVAVLEGLEGAPAEAAASWLAQARARLAAEAALAELREAALEKLATAAPSGAQMP